MYHECYNINYFIELTLNVLRHQFLPNFLYVKEVDLYKKKSKLFLYKKFYEKITNILYVLIDYMHF